MIPIGKLIQKKMEEKELTVVWLSKEVPCSRANIYKLFNKTTIDTEMLFRISHIIGFDFFQYYSQGLNKD